MPNLWAGIDVGKTHHHCVVIDAEGQRLLSRKVRNDESELLDLVSGVLSLGARWELTWATDLNHGGAALLVALLSAHDQRVLCISGRTVHHASRIYRGEGKTDAKDAAVIADQARMRRDLQLLRVGDEVSVDLRILTARRADKAMDRTRAINRFRAQLLEYFPALERSFDYSRSKAALLLLTKYRTPEGLRRLGQVRLQVWLKNQGARSSAAVAETAIAAPKEQHTTVPAQRVGEMIVAALAREVLDLQEELSQLDALISERVVEHRRAPVLMSMPGFGAVLSAEFLGVTGGHERVRERRPFGWCRRSGAGAAGLGANQRQPPPATAVRSPAVESLLSGGHVQSQKLDRVTDLLRP